MFVQYTSTFIYFNLKRFAYTAYKSDQFYTIIE